MTTKCKKITGDVLDSGSIDYGFTDKAGRKVGYSWSIRSCRFDAIREGDLDADQTRFNYGYYSIEDDKVGVTFFRMHGTPTRNGKGYGPAFNYVDCATLEAARRLAVGRVEAARKRDAKKFAA